jgi:type IV secretion system protein VirD4
MWVIESSSLPPIRAEKVRYYEDAQLKDRILPAPSMRRSPEEWDFGGGSELQYERRTTRSSQPEPESTKSGEPIPDSAAKDECDAENAGIRREPTLPEHQAVIREDKVDRRPEQLTLSFDDYMLGEGAPRRTLADAAERKTMRKVVRQAAIDPGDRLGL